jgi:hypothetical protein
MKFKAACILLCFATGVSAQGLVFNDEAYKKSPRETDAQEGAKDLSEILKNTFKIDLKPYCPTVGEQGRISSCVGWSVGYAAMTIEKAVANNWASDQQTIDGHAFSAMFVYNQIKLGDCFFGAELNHAFAVLKEKGNVFYRDFAVNNNCDSVPLGKLMEKARLNRVKDFAVLFNPDDKAATKVDRVKRTLARQKPVVVGMIVLENFLSLKSGDGMWYPTVGKTDLFGGHAMVVVGYDDGRKAFEVMNSWGKGWANQGFAWVRYEDFAKYCKYAYQLVLENEESNYLEGNIQVLKPVLKSVVNGDADVVFSSLPFVNKHSQYALGENTNLPLEFQLVADGFRKGTYLYVISFDKTFKPSVHWPRDERLNRHFSAEYESAVITGQSTITVPGKYNVFALSEPGTEYICVLNSTRPITNLPERLTQISRMKGALSLRIRKVFSPRTEGEYTSSFENDRISFYSAAGKNDIVSILLEFDLKK